MICFTIHGNIRLKPTLVNIKFHFKFFFFIMFHVAFSLKGSLISESDESEKNDVQFMNHLNEADKTSEKCLCRRQLEYELNEKSAKLYRQKSTLNKFD